MSCTQCSGIEREFDARAAKRKLRHFRRKGSASTTRKLLGAIAEEPVARHTFIDIGGGIGAVAHELMARGAEGGTHADASPAFLDAARTLAETKGYAGRIRYLGGDFVERAAEIAPANIVTLDRVVCCYPDMPALLEAAAPLARRTLGLVLPRGTAFVRFGIGLVNAVQRLRGRAFRVFAHDPVSVAGVLERLGFEERFQLDGWLWRVQVVGRRGSPNGSF